MCFVAVVANNIHAVVIALAASSIGAIFSLAAPDMGKQVRFYAVNTPGVYSMSSRASWIGTAKFGLSYSSLKAMSNTRAK